MAVGYGNAATLSFATWTGLATPGASAGLVQSISSPGWTREIGDGTSIDAADALLRFKIASGRLEPNGITVPFFYDPSATGLDAPPLAAQVLTVTYPALLDATSLYTQNCFVSEFSIGNMIDDELSAAECVFIPQGKQLFTDPTQT